MNGKICGVNKNNLFISHARQLLNCQQQPLKFVLFNDHSICGKTLLVNDYILEHDIDLLAITESWLHGDSSEKFYCHNICPDGYRIEHIPRVYAGGGRVVLVCKKCFKVKNNQHMNFRSFKFMDVNTTSYRYFVFYLVTYLFIHSLFIYYYYFILVIFIEIIYCK